MKKNALLPAMALGLAFLGMLAGSGKRGLQPSPTKPQTAKLPPRILLVGDSFAVGLAGPLSELAAAAGAAFESHGEVGTRIDQWADKFVLDDYLRTFHPTHILVSLGANDEAATTIPLSTVAEKLSKLEKRLLSALPGEPPPTVLWIGPPPLRYPERGARQLILRAVRDYFDSSLLAIPRAPDGLHPITYRPWAKAVWQRLLPKLGLAAQA